jgi:hypothetical protein
MRVLPYLAGAAFFAGAAFLAWRSPSWYFLPVPLGIFILALWLLRNRSPFYVLCAGELTVILAGPVNLWASLALQLVLLLYMSGREGVPGGVWEYASFAFLTLAAAVAAAWITGFRHVTVPLIVIMLSGAAFAGVILVAERSFLFRFRREAA